MYAVFMCHLALEKALKGLYQNRLGTVPPKTHNLGFLLEQTGVSATEETALLLTEINEAHLATRYPENLIKLQKSYPDTLVRRIIERTKDVLKWIRQQQ